MALKVGTYKFAKKRNHWGIWMVESIVNGVTVSCFIKDVFSFEEAVTETYRLNGWGTPKNIVRKY